MRIVITGAGGQLGNALARRAGAEHQINPCKRQDIDVSDYRAVMKIAAERPDIVVNTAAITDVDGCEHDRDGAFRVNALGARNVAHAAGLVGAEVVQISTDYVFPGDGGREEPYWEFDTPSPLSVYGASKLAGERMARQANPRIYIVRTAWLYGLGGRGFVSRMLELAERGEALSVVDNEFGNPTFCDDLADAILALVGTGVHGTYHLVNEGHCSRHEFASAILEMAGHGNVEVKRISHYARVARPPQFGGMRNFAAAELGVRLPPWREGLRRYFERRSIGDETASSVEAMGP